MLDDVGDPGIVAGRRGEAERKEVFLVGAGKVHDLAARPDVAKEQPVSAYSGRAARQYFEPFDGALRACHCLLDIRMVPPRVYDGHFNGTSGSTFCYTPPPWNPTCAAGEPAQAPDSAIRSGPLRDAGYAEVDTPILSPFLVPEPAIEVFQAEYLPPKGAARPMWLAPSPELWMKRLMAAGAGDIFQISRSFRNGEYGGPHHNPEFHLLE